jgi:K319-like protein
MNKTIQAALAILLITGCGSSGGGKDAGGPPPDGNAFDLGPPDVGPNLPPVVTCPTDQTVEVNTAASLVAMIDDDGTIESRLWEVISAPSGSKATPVPVDSSGTSFTPLLPGDYQLRYTAQDDAGQSDSCEVRVTATVAAGLRVELLWDIDVTPPPPADMDLHLLHPTATVWFNDAATGLDCFWMNPSAAWGPGGAEDDPALYMDDQDGRGPEGIQIAVPEEGGDYRIGVHFYTDNGAGPSDAIVRVYCAGTLIQTFGPQTLDGSDNVAPDQNDFWKVADVSFSGGGCTIVPLDDGLGGPLIVTAGDARLAR